MTMLSEGNAPQPALRPGTGGFGGYVDGVLGVVGMEMRQRLRSRGWYIMLGIWFGLIWLVTALTWMSWKAQSGYNFDPGFGRVGPGSLIFEAVCAFVLLFGLLVAPAFSANAVSGDRSAGTLAILQVTLLRPGQILWGKFLASWIVSLAFLVVSVPFLIFGIAQGGLGFGYIFVALLLLAVELGIVCALGVGISALANRPLFSIVVTYLVVALLVFGTLIAFGLGAMVSKGPVQANQMGYQGMYYENNPDAQTGDAMPPGVTDQDGNQYCYGPLQEQTTVRTDRVAWLLAMNPFVVVADATPYGKAPLVGQRPEGIFEVISQGARYAQAGPDSTYPCANGKLNTGYLDQKTPLWPLGLGLQLLVTAGIVALGWRALRTPAGKLPKGTRVA